VLVPPSRRHRARGVDATETTRCVECDKDSC
jgi:hypothetical protein